MAFDGNHMADWTAEECQGLLGFRKSPLTSDSSPSPDGDTTDMPVTGAADSDIPDTAETSTENSDLPETIV